MTEVDCAHKHSQPYLRTWNGHCLRYPSGFDVDKRSAPDMIYVYGPERRWGQIR